ncbi:hypothetical protein [Brevibacterium litoralis]|uniref:hypothetical protein n=1 Tax=Brevibacterium litoralis TaxID=3138935 RepID=UPI0032EDA89A
MHLHHDERPAAYLAEALGGPALYSAGYGDEAVRTAAARLAAYFRARTAGFAPYEESRDLVPEGLTIPEV